MDLSKFRECAAEILKIGRELSSNMIVAVSRALNGSSAGAKLDSMISCSEWPNGVCDCEHE